MDKLLSGKVAVVTGGTRGIGRAIAERLLREGAKLAFCGRTPETVKRAARELAQATDGTVFGEAADVSNPKEVESFFQRVDKELGGLHLLINNAGLGIFRRVSELALDEWRQMIDLNLSGVFYCSREALRRFNNREGGYIINISSLAGKNAFAGGAGYNASKFGLNGFSEAMMLDHRNAGVRVSTIMPGSVETEFGGSLPGSDKNAWKIAPEDIAEIVATVLRMPRRTTISQIEVRPSRPPGKA